MFSDSPKSPAVVATNTFAMVLTQPFDGERAFAGKSNAPTSVKAMRKPSKDTSPPIWVFHFLRPLSPDDDDVTGL